MLGRSCSAAAAAASYRYLGLGIFGVSQGELALRPSKFGPINKHTEKHTGHRTQTSPVSYTNIS